MFITFLTDLHDRLLGRHPDRLTGPATRLGDTPELHIEAWWDHRAEQQHRIEQAEDLAERAAAAAAWERLSDEEQHAVIAECDDLDLRGQLEDHRFYDQWIALRMEGYVGH